MPRYLAGKVVFVIGPGGDEHRCVAVALAEAGADVAVGGRKSDLAAEAQLHSIANEIWAIGRKSTVITIEGDSSAAFAAAVNSVIDNMGAADIVVRCEAVLNT